MEKTIEPSVAERELQASRGKAPLPKRLIADARTGLGALGLALVAVLLGIGAGLAAFAFRALIAFIHNLCFLGSASFHYDASVHTPPGPFGPWVAVAPVIGAVIVVFLVKHFAPEAKGHGVPEVVDAIYYGRSIIRPVVAAVKSLASAVSIGSGGSVGREGPIVQISAAFASWLGGVAHVSRWQRATLIAAGGGAGIAATFNTPIGGVLFAVEVLMHEVSVRTLVPVALATATATYVGQAFFGTAPAFIVPQVHASSSPLILPAYVLLGGLMALVAVCFVRVLYGTEDLFERLIPRREYLRHVIGMVAVGATIVVVMRVQGHYYVEGVGYATIVDVLTGGITSVAWLIALFALKLFATSVTLGSGGSGGVFSPSLFMGATLGGAFGLVLHWLFPHAPIDPAAFALAGMAGLVAGATGAALTAVVMIFEMTLDYGVVLPMALTVAVAHGARRLLMAQNVYTMKLFRRGHYVPEALLANPHLVHHIGDMRIATAKDVLADAPTDNVAASAGADAPAYIVLRDSTGGISDVVLAEVAVPTRAAARRPRVVGDGLVVASPDTTLFDLLAAMQRAKADLAVVVEPSSTGIGAVRGVVTKTHVAEALAEGMEIFED